MNNKYVELQAKHSKQINEFPMGFAFSDKQFGEMKEKLGVKSNDEMISLSGGGFIKKEDKADFRDAFLKRCTETEEAMKDDEYLFQGFLYELANHEFCITGDPEDTLDCFGLTIDEVNADERLSRIFKEARKEYVDNCYDY